MAISGFDSDLNLLENFAESQGYYYYLARTSKDFFNLVDEPHNGLYFFHAQDRVGSNNNEQTGAFISKFYRGKIWIAIKSDLDGVIHKDKKIQVERILSLQIDQDLKQYFCKDYVFKLSDGKPFYNLFTTNYDGIMFDYEVEVDKIFKLKPSIKDNYIRNGIFAEPS